MIRDKHCWIFLGALFLSMVYTPFAQTALLVSERQVQQRFEQRWEQMIKTVPLSRNASKRAQVQCVTKQIIKKLDEPYRSYYDWEVKLFVDPRVQAEAFYMMEAGGIAVAEGIFKVVANQDELAVIIGHEIVHILNKHPYEMKKRVQRADIGMNLATMVAAGKIADQTMRSQSDVILAQTKISGIGAMAQGISRFGLQMPYKRNLEKEADIDGLLLMARTGFNPLAAISVWKKMVKQDDRKLPQHEYSSSHPSDEDRMKDLLLNQREALKQYNAVESKPNCGYK
jgi:predicted Zn-dependent protease